MAHWVGPWLYGVKFGANDSVYGFASRADAEKEAVARCGKHYSEQNVTVFAYEDDSAGEGGLVDDGV